MEEKFQLESPEQASGAPTYSNLDNQIGRHRRLSLQSTEDVQENTIENEESPWDAVDNEDLVLGDADLHELSQSMTESSPALELLKIAACLSSLDTRLLNAFTSSNVDASTILSNETAKGIVTYNSNENGYTFASPPIQKALYLSIPQDQRGRQHLLIGRNLIRNLSQQELEESYYYAVLRQFHLGMDVIKRQDERYLVASICLNAAQSAVGKSDFDLALKYLNFGLELLESGNCWKDEYELTLSLFNALAEIEYSKCNFDRVDELVATILNKAACFRDTLRAHAAQIYALSSRYQMTQAVDTSLDVLRELGEPMPANPTKRQVLLEFLKTKHLLRGKTNEMLLRMPLMTDPDKIATSQILNLMVPSAFRSRPLLFALVVFRLVRLSCKYGLSAVSAVGFGYYGSLLCAFSIRDVDRGYGYGQLSLGLLDKFQTKEWTLRVYLGVYGHTGSYKLSLQEMVPKLKYARQIGLETGDIEYASNSSNIICAYIHLSGESLVVLEETCIEYYQFDAFKKQETSALYMETCLQYVHNLTGRNADPLRLCGEILKDEADILNRVMDHHDEVGIGFTHFLTLQLSYIFNEYDSAAAKAPEMLHLVQPPYLQPTMACPYTFYSLALLAVYSNRKGRARRHILSVARRSIKKLQQFSNHTPENCLGKTYLLRAEVAAVTGKVETATRMYASAAGVSSEFNDRMMHAIACERAALFFQGLGNELATKRYIRKAHSAYRDWGATAKVKQVESKWRDFLD